MEIPLNTNFDFLGKKGPSISVLLLLPSGSVAGLAAKGLRYRIDVRGGRV